MYWVALQGVSRYALSEAVKRIMRGGLSHTFFPSPVELRQQCEAAMEPHRRMAQRAAILDAHNEENRAYARSMAQKTPEARARVSAAYEQFCASYSEEKKVKPSLILDPELVAKLPDAKTPFQRAKVA